MTSPYFSLWILPLLMLCAYLITGRLRGYAQARRLLDVPNARSSHDVPTPRGGGLAIVLCFLGVIPLLVSVSALERASAIALAGSGALAALIGFLDDHGHVPARWRLLAHFIAAGWALAWLDPGPWITAALPGLPNVVGLSLAGLFLVWMLNLYNFMDGIDGIASVEAISVCAGGAMLFWLGGAVPVALVPLSLAAAVAGFLVWNFPPAKIFMGDAGSGFLGVALGMVALLAGAVAPRYFWSWLILLAVFVVDATWTLMRRALRGEKVYEAHRSHAYQRSSRRIGRHLPVTLSVAAINLLWLTPLALAVGAELLTPWQGMAIAYVPLVLLALSLGAGAAE